MSFSLHAGYGCLWGTGGFSVIGWGEGLCLPSFQPGRASSGRTSSSLHQSQATQGIKPTVPLGSMFFPPPAFSPCQQDGQQQTLDIARPSGRLSPSGGGLACRESERAKKKKTKKTMKKNKQKQKKKNNKKKNYKNKKNNNNKKKRARLLPTFQSNLDSPMRLAWL